MRCDVRRVEAPQTQELYITAGPGEAAEVFAAVAQRLRACGASILQERLFATEGTMDEALAVRAAVYGELDDGVPPARLIAPPGWEGPVAGVQVHAAVLSAPLRPELVHVDGQPRGRLVRQAERAWVGLSGLTAPPELPREAQARLLFEQADAALRQAGGSMHSVARTWLWLRDILAWYGPFNRVRNTFFTERGLMNGSGRAGRLPASTGIGIAPAGGGALALDLVALAGGEQAIDYHLAGGNQQPASDYGSAFSRAARMPALAGPAVYVSGTASIDPSGRTVHVGDARAQIDATIANVRAVLRDCGCTDSDVVQSVIYCKTPHVVDLFRQIAPSLPWPWTGILTDVCRDDLLFEIEATAARGARAG